MLVRSHFNRLKESLCRDEETALDMLTSHVNSRVATLNTYIEKMDAIHNKLSSTSSELQRSLVLERSKLVERKSDLLALAEAATIEEIHHPGDSNFEIAFIVQEDSVLSTLIPYSISRTNQLHIGHYEDARVVLLGLDGAGKTTLLRSIMRAPYVPDISPTNGYSFTVDSIHYKNFRLHLWDVSGLNRSRNVWKNYHSNAQAIIFVVDSSAPERFPEVIRVVEEVVEDSHIDSCQLLLVVNRKATEHTASCPSIASLLGSLPRFGQPIKVHYCDAANGRGVPELLDYLVDSLVPGRDNL
ncbi:ADP-ribosylation factor family protein [Necator americanus]|uniref:ADP-ribosylation factor family protein n=1 Tax=Necator americanus TaxID=51031 RepID=W2TC27_NECAM|nr:ADP-ribosylation factor family protein [Necator americanus]ETN78557.1 ADP-ribosylation factor family protein [Necator americanus]